MVSSVATARQTFSAAASIGPVKMWSGACDESIYLRLKNTFLDFYTDEAKEVKRSAMARSMSVDSSISKGARGREAAMAASTRSPSPAPSTAFEVESISSDQAQNSAELSAAPWAQRPGTSVPATPDASLSGAAPANFISLADALSAKPAPTSKDAKGRGKKADLSKFQAKPESDVTTVMLRGIPCGLTKTCVMEMMDKAGLAGKYDFFYLPMASQAKGNLGYAFVNFAHPMYATLCKARMHGVSMDPVRSTKVCTINPADIQGLSSLRKHFRKTAVSHSRHGPVFLKVDHPPLFP